MYHYLEQRFGQTTAFWGTALWYGVLITLVVLSFVAPAGEFRYGDL